MDAEFVIRNEIVERYLGGRLPLKGAQDFEQFCRAHPKLLDEIRLSDRLHAGLRLLEAGGRSLPWELPPPKFWQKWPLLAAVTGLALLLAITSMVLIGRLHAREHEVTTWQRRAATQPLDAADSTQAVTVVPNRTAPSLHSLATIGGTRAQMADLRFDMSWSKFSGYQVMIDRVDQGRVAVLHNLQKDSAGDLHIALNSSALGPGDYRFTIEGLNWKGEPVPQAWAMISVVH